MRNGALKRPSLSVVTVLGPCGPVNGHRRAGHGESLRVDDATVDGPGRLLGQAVTRERDDERGGDGHDSRCHRYSSP